MKEKHGCDCDCMYINLGSGMKKQFDGWSEKKMLC